MKKDTRYELYKGIWVTDADDIPFNHGERSDLSKYTQFDRGLNKPSWSVQAVCDKIAKNNCWPVIRYSFDHKTKGITYEVMLNADTSVNHNVTYKEICLTYGWKSFNVSDDGQMLVPKL